MSRTKQKARIMSQVLSEMSAWKGQHNHGDGMTAAQHARAHPAGLSPERRAELHGEWQ